MNTIDTNVLILPESLTIDIIREYHSQIVNFYTSSTSSEYTVDLENTTRIDSAGMQLLICLKNEAKAMGLVIKWKGVGEKPLEASRLLGIKDLFTNNSDSQS